MMIFFEQSCLLMYPTLGKYNPYYLFKMVQYATLASPVGTGFENLLTQYTSGSTDPRTN